MKTNRTVIVQCRLSSTRLPGKALKELNGKPVLAYVLSSMKKVRADYYYLATDEASYSQLLPVCREYGFECYAGSLDDVLNRFTSLLKTIKTKTVIRATADNPFLFYEAAEESAALFEEKNSGSSHCDYLTYSDLPHGSGVEVFSAEALIKAESETTDPYDHEHVGPALYNHKDRYICEFVPAPRRYDFPELRTTIDTYSDFLRAFSMMTYLKAHSYEGPFTTEEILEACRANSVKYPVVLVPSVVKGHGTGHLRRCLSAAVQGGFFVYIPEDKSLAECDAIVKEYLAAGLSKNQIINTIPDESYLPAIITDTFELTENQLKELAKNRSLISIDEGSKYTDYCDYLLDIIPSYKCDRPANKTDSAFITMPENVKTGPVNKDKIEKVLICLGGEDPSNLTMPAAQAFRKKFPDAKITAIISNEDSPYVDYAGGPNIEFIKPVPGLREKLYDYDIVVTHYGLTAFEAVYAGCGVILLPTTNLHKKLAEKYNFAFVGDKKISESSIQNALASENLFAKKLTDEKKSLGDFLRHLAAGKRMCCPVCGRFPSQPDQVISRNESRTYRRCASCGMVYMGFTTVEDKKYQKAYFFEEYKKQYGKTYEEDFDSIKAQGIRRAGIIKSLSGPAINPAASQDKSLLDIGCAYGPFLAAASDTGFNPFGTDISDDAVSYVQQKLKYPAVCSVFPEIDTAEEFGIAQFDVVTMWYVIEHFKDLGSVLRKVSSLVKKGGIFAFSTPSGEGISAVSDKDHFYQISPTDHYTIWEPSRADSILRVFGFRVERIVSTGHHPERFPSIKKSGAKPGSLKWMLAEAQSHAKRLGDTVEIYCRKI